MRWHCWKQKAERQVMNDDEKGKCLTSKGIYVDRKLSEAKLNSQEMFYAMAYSNAEKTAKERRDS